MNLEITDSITLTVCDGDDTALLTTRGKDHDLTVAHLRAVRDACDEAIRRIEGDSYATH